MLFFLISGLVHSQKFDKVFEHEIDRSFMKFLDGVTAEFSITPSGKYLVIATEEYVKLIDDAGREIFTYDCIPKANTKAGLGADIFGGKIGSMLENIKLDEGSAFWMFEDDNIMIVLDWNLDNNIVLGYDLSTGEKIWEQTGYRYTPGKDGQLAAVLAASALTAVANESLSMASIMGAEAFRSIHSDMHSREGTGNVRAKAFISPMPGTDCFLLTHKDGISSINKMTGEEEWNYDERPLKIGEVTMIPGHDDVFLSNYSPNFFLKSESYLVRLDLESGEEIAMVDYKGDFTENQISFIDNMYLIDGFGIEAYDLGTDEMLYEVIPKDEYEESTQIKAVKAEKDFIYPSNAWFDKENFYYSRSSGDTKEKWVSAYNIKSGKQLWKSDMMDSEIEICGLSENNIVIKQFGIGKNFFMNLSKKSGEVTAGPVKIKQNLMVDERKPWLFISEKYVIHNGKKRLHFLNKNDLTEAKAVKTKKAKVGELKAMDLLPDGLIMVGSEGVAFYDRDGNFENRVKIKSVNRALWTPEYILVITEGNVFKSGNIFAINIQDQKMVDEIEIADMTIFSPELDHFLRADDKKDSILKFYTIR